MMIIHWSSIVFLLLFTTRISSLAAATALPPPSTPFSTQSLKSFLQNKCQNPLTKNAAIWSYEGHLVDPTNGNIIANVEGIELVRSLTEITRPSSTEKKQVWNLIRGLRRLDDLKVRSMLANPGWDYAGTVLSRKLFCYSPVDKGGLMREYRLHPTAPLRKLKIEDAVSLYDTATTFISTEGGKGMVVLTEWPDGHWIQSDATSIGFQASAEKETTMEKEVVDGRKCFEFTVYARRSGKGETPVLPPPPAASKSMSRNEKDGDSSSLVMKSVPPRSKFVQFGRDDSAEDRRYGARETYSYMIGCGEMTRMERIKSKFREAVLNIKERVGLWDFDFDGKEETIDPYRSCTVRYTRFGEAPVWYGPGKMCTLELWGRRVESVADAPPLAATLAATRIPGFLSVHTSIPPGPDYDNVDRGTKPLSEKEMKEQMGADEAAIKAVGWFRGGKEGSLPLEILKEDDQSESPIESMVHIGLSLAQKIRAATTTGSPVEL